MILQTVRLKNFMCFYGENEFEFTEGLNVIIGDNGYGKSKVYDAIYWVMYDKCFDTGADEFRPTRLLNNKLVSDRTVHEADDGLVECSVSLTFYDSRNEDTYTLKRSLKGTKKDHKVNFGTVSKLKVTKKTALLSGKIVDNEEQIERIKRKILPNNIKPYMWFQGEQIDNIIDFKNSETLTQAINVLSDITKFDNISSITGSLFSSAKKKLRKKQKALSKDEKKSDELDEQIDQKKSRLTDYRLQLKNSQKSSQKAQDRIDDLLSKLDVAEKIRDLDSNRSNTEDRFKDLFKRLKEAQYSFHEKLFTRSWVLKTTENLFKEYSAKKSKYDDNKINQRAEIQAQKNIKGNLQTRLPINVPEPIYVNKMLEGGKCLVCNRDAPKGSDAYNAIESLLSDTKESLNKLEDEESNKYDFSTTFKTLYDNGLIQKDRIKNIDQDIANTLSNIEDLRNQKNKAKKDFEEINNEIENYILENSINLNEAKKITHEIKAKQSIVSDHKTSIGYLKKQIESLRQEIGRLEKKYESLVKGKIPDKLKTKEQICSDLNMAAISTRERVFQELIERLEKEANKHYQNMTQDNLSARGIIRLKQYEGNYTPELIDNKGNIFTQVNTGNILLIKLATIMAIISARKTTRGTYLYTLISDAPMSVFGEDYTIGFCKTASQVYRQSIIMSKDFYNNEALKKELMTSDDINLGNVYMITPTIPESKRENRLKLSTKIESLN